MALVSSLDFKTHFLVLSCEPPPHVTEHLFQDDHCVHDGHSFELHVLQRNVTQINVQSLQNGQTGQHALKHVAMGSKNEDANVLLLLKLQQGYSVKELWNKRG